MQVVRAIVRRQPVLDAVEREAPARDPVGVAADERAEIR
jgi:hypothetical protein